MMATATMASAIAIACASVSGPAGAITAPKMIADAAVVVPTSGRLCAISAIAMAAAPDTASPADTP